MRHGFTTVAFALLALLALSLPMGCKRVHEFALSQDNTDSNDTDSGSGGSLRWVSIPGGTFEMGSLADSDEQPVHPVTVPAFEMSETEVTVSQYGECVKAAVCTDPGTSATYGNWGAAGYEDHPVNYVNWQQCVIFCTWAGGRLPTESEWEYAGSNGSAENVYPWGDTPATCDYAVMEDATTNTEGCGTGRTWPVCSKVAGNTSHGLCDMAGNVWEWVQDWYHSSYTGAPEDGSAWEDSGSARVLRGGYFFNPANKLGAANRFEVDPSTQNAGFGCRCAR